MRKSALSRVNRQVPRVKMQVREIIKVLVYYSLFLSDLACKSMQEAHPPICKLMVALGCQKAKLLSRVATSFDSAHLKSLVKQNA